VQQRRLEVNGAKLYVEEAGTGAAVVLLHGGLGDCRLWDAQFESFAERFRTIRYDLRFFGRSDSPAAPYSLVDDLRALLDALQIESAALIGLSLGGQVAIDMSITGKNRVWALVPVCAAVSGFEDGDDYSPQQRLRIEAALERGDLESAADVALELWAPLGVTGLIRRLIRENAPGTPLPEGAVPNSEPVNAIGRLREIEAPTLVVSGDRDVPAINEIADELEQGIPGARRICFDSDHYLPLREGPLFNQVVLDFLTRHAA
jgi:3-oxoadipate enol-lactonase